MFINVKMIGNLIPPSVKQSDGIHTVFDWLTYATHYISHKVLIITLADIFLRSCTPKKPLYKPLQNPLKCEKTVFQMDIKKRHTFFWSIDCTAFKVLWISICSSTPVSFFSNNKEGIEKKANIVSMCTQIPAQWTGIRT